MQEIKKQKKALIKNERLKKIAYKRLYSEFMKAGAELWQKQQGKL